MYVLTFVPTLERSCSNIGISYSTLDTSGSTRTFLNNFHSRFGDSKEWWVMSDEWWKYEAHDLQLESSHCLKKPIAQKQSCHDEEHDDHSCQRLLHRSKPQQQGKGRRDGNATQFCFSWHEGDTIMFSVTVIGQNNAANDFSRSYTATFSRISKQPIILDRNNEQGWTFRATTIALSPATRGILTTSNANSQTVRKNISTA